jgi:hypothetical protein
MPIGAICIGYSDEPPRDLSSRRRPLGDTVHRGQWGNLPAAVPDCPNASPGVTP